MPDFVLGERRRELRWAGASIPVGFSISMPGVHSVELIDASPGGVGIRATSPLRPGRVMVVRCRERANAGERQRTALVVRCQVYRLSRGGVTYEAGLSWQGATASR